MKYKINKLTAYILVALSMASVSYGTIVIVPSTGEYFTGTETGGGAGDNSNDDYKVVKQLQSTFTNEESLYISFDYQLQGNLSGNHVSEINIGSVYAPAFGFRRNFSTTHYMMSIPGGGQFNTGLEHDPNESVKIVYKINQTQTTNNVTVFVGARLGETEGSNSNNNWTYSAGDYGPIQSYQVYEGNWDHPDAYVATTTVNNIEIYTGMSTPFAVPEPETYALIFGGLTLGFVMLRRRLKN